MKTLSIIITCAVIAISSSLSAQSSDKALDGKSYQIKAWSSDNDQLKTPETLVFKDGKVDAPVCHMYGFYEAEYRTFEKSGETYFNFSSKSDSEGTIVFAGTVKDHRIEGTYTWLKEGQSDLVYQFEGSTK